MNSSVYKMNWYVNPMNACVLLKVAYIEKNALILKKNTEFDDAFLKYVKQLVEKTKKAADRSK